MAKVKVDVIGNDFGFLFSKEFARVPSIGESISVSCPAGNCNVYQVEDVCWTVNKIHDSAVAVITINTASTDGWIALIMQEVSKVAIEGLPNMDTAVNKGNVKYEVRTTGKLIAFVSSHRLAKLVSGIYMLFSDSNSVCIEQVFPWEDDYNLDTHISILKPKSSSK